MRLELMNYMFKICWVCDMGILIWVEGNDDEILFNRVIKPILDERYDWVEVRKHSRIKNKKICDFIKSLNAMNEDYVFLTDLDDYISIKAKLDEVCECYKEIDRERIILVIKEVEGWYFAGITEKNAKKLKIKLSDFRKFDPNTIRKEQFNEKVKPKKYNETDFKIEIIKLFDITHARERNGSFEYLLNYFNIATI